MGGAERSGGSGARAGREQSGGRGRGGGGLLVVGAERGGGWAPWRPAKAVEEPVEAFVLTLSAEGRSGSDVERWREGRAEREGCTRRERRERREHVAGGEGEEGARTKRAAWRAAW